MVAQRIDCRCRSAEAVVDRLPDITTAIGGVGELAFGIVGIALGCRLGRSHAAGHAQRQVSLVVTPSRFVELGIDLQNHVAVGVMLESRDGVGVSVR